MRAVTHTAMRTHAVSLSGNPLSLREIYAVATCTQPISLASEQALPRSLLRAHQFIQHASEKRKPTYGVNTGFGGMGKQVLSHEETTCLQENLLHFLQAGAGELLAPEPVRAGMVIIANALLKGVSGIRYEVVQRYALFLEKNVVPDVYALGSIGASGDLIPLAAVAGVLTGHSDGFTAKYNGKTYTSSELMEVLQLERIVLLPKEGLAMVNSTAMLTGIATVNLMEWRHLFVLSLYAHALMMEAMVACLQPFDPFVHQYKPHPGQQWIAQQLYDILRPSELIRNNGELIGGEQRLYQDRYSIRCIPQFLGPMLDAFRQVYHQVQTEANAVTDNPLIDIERYRVIHGGNFMGEYVALGMDQLRNHIGIMAKHLDVQMAMLMTPEFSDGLPPSLSGNTTNGINMGLKGLQITGNSIVPLLLFYGNPIADKFQTHAEQFNQNINSQGYNAAVLTGRSIELFRQYVAIALIVAVQAVDLRARKLDVASNVKKLISPSTYPIYKAVRQLCKKPIEVEGPLVFNDRDQQLNDLLRSLTADILHRGELIDAAQPLIRNLDVFLDTTV